MNTHPSELGALPWQVRVRRLDDMAQKASATPEIRTLALSIVRELGLRPSPAEMADALQEWVASHIAFIPETYEVFLCPLKVLEVGASDCDGHAGLLASLLLAVGIPAQIAGFGEAGQPPSHVAVLAWIEGRWWTYDSTTDGLLESCALPNGQSCDFAPPPEAREELGGWGDFFEAATGYNALLETTRFFMGDSSAGDLGWSLLLAPEAGAAAWEMIRDADYEALKDDFITIARRVKERPDVVFAWVGAAGACVGSAGTACAPAVASAAKYTLVVFGQEAAKRGYERMGEEVEARLERAQDEASSLLREIAGLEGYERVRNELLLRGDEPRGGRFGQRVTVVPTYASPGYPNGLRGLISLEEWGIYSREGRLNWLEENGHPLHYGYHHVDDPNQVPVVVPQAIEDEMSLEEWGMMGLSYREEWLEARGLPASWADVRNLPEMQPRGFGDLTLVIPLYPSDGFPQGLEGFISLEEWAAFPEWQARVDWLRAEGLPLHYAYHHVDDPYQVPVVVPAQARDLISLEGWGMMGLSHREDWLEEHGMPRSWADVRNLPEMQPVGALEDLPDDTRRDTRDDTRSEGEKGSGKTAAVVGTILTLGGGIAAYFIKRSLKGGR